MIHLTFAPEEQHVYSSYDVRTWRSNRSAMSLVFVAIDMLLLPEQEPFKIYSRLSFS